MYSVEKMFREREMELPLKERKFLLAKVEAGE